MGNSSSKQESLTDAVQFGPCGTDPYAYLSFDESELPRGLKFSMKFLTREEFEFCQRLCDMGQEHLFDEWDEMGAEERLVLVRQLMRVEDEMKSSGGLKKYLNHARKLLDEAYYDAGRTSMPLMNPSLRGWSPSVPAENQVYDIGSPEYLEMEEKGMAELAGVGFCVVAVQTSEALVPGSTKFALPKFQLPIELSTEASYLQVCIEHILHISRTYGKKKHLPLCIMTSQETDGLIRQYLESNNFFGMDPTSIHVLSRYQGIPALEDSDARMALDPNDPRLVLLKDRGHGDFHSLLMQSGTALQWLEERGLRWLYMIGHDTNGLAFHTLPLMLGVSKERGLIMNTLAVPRKAKDPFMGAICALKNRRSGLYKTASIEWNELDALLRSKGYEEGEINDQKTGYSRFPGNSNQILFNLYEYVAIMSDARGQVPKVICPKIVEEVNEEEDDDDEKLAWGKNTASTDDESTHSSRYERRSSNKRKSNSSSKNNINKVQTKSKKSLSPAESSTMADFTNDDDEQDKPLFFEMPEAQALQSRMQDFVHLLTTSEDLDRVGFTMVTPAELSFSPVVRSVADHADPTQADRKAFPPYTASAAEANQYALARKMLQSIGCHVETARPVTYAGDIEVIPGPAIVLKPNFAFCLTELKEKIPNPGKVRISPRSTLVIRGEDIIVESLDLDGCLLVDCEDGQQLTIADRVIKNAGWTQVKDPYAVQETHRMRGYSILRKKEEAIEALEKTESSCYIM
ncbi:hypothetical protein ACA910_020138 [Epithemia clementina (nom. ined.)]